MTDYSVIGQSVPRIDGDAKVTGQGLYAADVFIPGMLRGKILRSPLPHGMIRHIDTSQAERLPGVKAVVTGRDTLGVAYGASRFGQKYLDELGLAIDKVRYFGDEVAAVAAIDEDVAEEAIRLVRVDYEPLPAVFDPRAAILPGAPQIHDHAPDNISRRVDFDFGDVEKGFADSYHVREDSFFTAGQAHAPFESHAALASFDASGKLTVWSSTQVPYYVKNDLAYTLGIPISSVRVILPYVGGGFGAKADGMFSVDFCAALLSRKTGRPVQIAYTREEEFATTRRRHPIYVEMKTGVSRDGVILAKHTKCILDGGGYTGIGTISVALSGALQNLPYRMGSFKYEGIRAFTNNPVSGAMRGHGAPQVHFAAEVQMDRLAADLGMDPLEIRIKNALKVGDVTLNGYQIKSWGFDECLRSVMENSGWKEKWGKLPPNRGIGIGCAGFYSGANANIRPDLPAYSGAVVKLNEDGSIQLLSGATDSGQGSDTLLVQIVAEEIGVNVSDVRFTRADTDITPVDLGNFSSRETMFAGNACKAAAAELKQKLLAELAGLLEASVDDIEIKVGRVFVKGSPDRARPLRDLAHPIYLQRRGKPLESEGTFYPPAKLNNPTYGFGAQVAEVEVDPETGKVSVLHVASAHDCGRAINPMAVESQTEGSIHMAMGWTLMENLSTEDGRVVNPTFLEYRMPTAIDMPTIVTEHVETDDPVGPFGAKEVGEGIFCLTAGAIANAVRNATGTELHSLPITELEIVDGTGHRQSRDTAKQQSAVR